LVDHRRIRQTQIFVVHIHQTIQMDAMNEESERTNRFLYVSAIPEWDYYQIFEFRD
jgi:hypothetical protein